MGNLIKTENQSLGIQKLFTPETTGKSGKGLSLGTIEGLNVFALKFYSYLDSKQIDSHNPIEFMQSGLTYLRESKKRLSPRTLKREKQFLKRLIVLNFPTANISKLDEEFKKLKIPTISETKTRILSRDEIQTILEKLEPETYRLFVRFLFNTGFRVSEMVGIKLSDCLVDGNNVFISVNGKGSKIRTHEIDVEFFLEIRNAFKSKTYLFENSKSENLQFTRQYINKIMNKAGRLINRKINPHLFRHSIATTLIESGESIKAIQAFLGHSDVTTTAKFYLHDSVKKETLDRVRV